MGPRSSWRIQWGGFRCGGRTLAGNPIFTVTAVLTLALATGATTAIFSVVNGVLLRPLPFTEPERDAEGLCRRQRVERLGADVQRVVRRKLRMLDAATMLDDLRVPPANRLEKPKGDRAGQHSICIDRRWRVCFVWRSGGAHDVEIVDYH
jgi:proteic killer suppression protein